MDQETAPCDPRVFESIAAQECAKDGLKTPGEVRACFEKMAAAELPKERAKRLDAVSDARVKNEIESDYVVGQMLARGVRGRVKGRFILSCPRCGFYLEGGRQVIADGKAINYSLPPCPRCGRSFP